MPLYFLIGAAGLVGAWSLGQSTGDSLGNSMKDAITIIGIATGVGIIIYAVHLSGGKK